MSRGIRCATLLLAGFALGALACELGPQSGRGLRLPDGDVEAGKIAFQELACTTCHDVAGLELEAPGDRPETIVVLGGTVTRVASYGELITSIINPTHDLSGRYPRKDLTVGEVSRMANFNDLMTVAQLVDLTAFLQSRYELRPEPLYVP